MIALTLPYPPSANVYWRSRAVTPKSGKAFASTYVSAEAKHFKTTAALLCARNNIKPLSGHIALTLRLYRPQRSGDLDNRIKVLLDCLQGLAYGNDDQVIELHAYRFDDRDNPRVEITIQSLNIQESLL